MPSVLTSLLWLYRQLPLFRGKYRLGYLLFKPVLEKSVPVLVRAKGSVLFHLPNSIENLGKEILVKGEYEIASTKAIVRRIGQIPQPVIFDVGANIGAIAIPVKRQVPAAHLYAFEASPATFGYLEKNVDANQLTNSHLVNKAVHSTDNAELQFFDAVEYGKSSLAPMYTDRAIKVQTITLDTFCREHRILQIDLLKVDVQGFEAEVFKGMENLLETKSVAWIFFEFEDWAEKAAGYEPGDSQVCLMEKGYEILDENGVLLTQPIRRGSCMLWARPMGGNTG